MTTYKLTDSPINLSGNTPSFLPNNLSVSNAENMVNVLAAKTASSLKTYIPILILYIPYICYLHSQCYIHNTDVVIVDTKGSTNKVKLSRTNVFQVSEYKIFIIIFLIIF